MNTDQKQLERRLKALAVKASDMLDECLALQALDIGIHQRRDIASICAMMTAARDRFIREAIAAGGFREVVYPKASVDDAMIEGWRRDDQAGQEGEEGQR